MKDKNLFKSNYYLYLKQQMILRGSNIKELSKKTGFSYEVIRRALIGKGSYRTVHLICKALQLNMKKIMKPDLLGKKINK